MTKLFIVITMIYWFTMYIYMPILTPLAEGLGASLRMVGLIVGSYGFTQMLIRIPIGILSDRIGRRKIFVNVGILLALISTIGIGLSTVPGMVLVFRALAGVAAATWVVFTVLYSSYFPPDEAAKVMGVIMFYTSLGQLFATTLGGFLADYFGTKIPFVVGGVVGLVGLLFSTQIKEPDTSSQEPIQLKQLFKVGRSPLLLNISILAILVQAINFSTIYGFNQSYAAGLGAADTQLSILMFTSALATALASLRSGAFAEKVGEKRLIVFSFLLMAVSSVTVPYTSSIRVLYFTQIFNGYGRGLVFPVLMGMSIESVSVDKRSTAMGFFQAIYGLGMFGGPVLVGYISDLWGLHAGYLFVGAIGLIGAILAGRMITDKKQFIKIPSALDGK